MRLILLLLLVFYFSSCFQKTPVSIFKMQNFIIADTSLKATDYLSYKQKYSDYPIYYIGSRSDTLRIGSPYKRGKTNWVNNFKIPCSRNYSDQTLKLFVDTSIHTNSTVDYFNYENDSQHLIKDSTKNFHSFIFSIQNISDSVIYLGKTFSVFFLNREAKDRNGNWIKVDKKLSELGICGTGQPIIILNPNEIVISKIRRYEGSFITDFRLVFGYDNNIVYSNIFKDSID